MSWSADYIGIPFRTRGRDRAGLDCYGLVRLVFAERLGIELPAFLDEYESLDHEELPHVARAIEANRGDWVEIPLGQEREFDVPLLRFSGLPIHVGVITKPGQMLHVMRGINAAHSDYLTPLMKPKLIGIFRHVDL